MVSGVYPRVVVSVIFILFYFLALTFRLQSEDESFFFQLFFFFRIVEVLILFYCRRVLRLDSQSAALAVAAPESCSEAAALHVSGVMLFLSAVVL